MYSSVACIYFFAFCFCRPRAVCSVLQSAGQRQLEETRDARLFAQRRDEAREAMRKTEREEDRLERLAIAEATAAARRVEISEAAECRKDEIAILQLQLKLANASGNA